MAGTSQHFTPYANPRSKVDFGVIGEAFTLFKDQAVTWIIAILILGGIDGILVALSTSLGLNNANLGAIINILMLLVNLFLLAGLIRMALNQIRGEEVSVADLFDFVDVAWQIVVAAIVMWILTSIGMMLCVIPGLIVSGLLMFTFPLIVDQKMNPLGALSSSFTALSEQWIMATVFYVVVSFLGSVGFAILFIGGLVTLPVALLSLVVLYHNFYFGSPQSDTNSPSGFDPVIPSGS